MAYTEVLQNSRKSSPIIHCDATFIYAPHHVFCSSAVYTNRLIPASRSISASALRNPDSSNYLKYRCLPEFSHSLSSSSFRSFNFTSMIIFCKGFFNNSSYLVTPRLKFIMIEFTLKLQLLNHQ